MTDGKGIKKRGMLNKHKIIRKNKKEESRNRGKKGKEYLCTRLGSNQKKTLGFDWYSVDTV